jgi:hypothetical protein
VIRPAALSLFACLFFPLAASAQGPMTVQPLHSGFVVAPDFKITEVDKTTSALVGGYAGWLTDETFFIGGGGYWLANDARDRQMGYGGLVLQWLVNSDRRVGFAAKGLVGGGRATLGTTVLPALRPQDIPDLRNLPAFRDLSRFGFDVDRLLRAPTSTRVRFREDFFVAEPQADVVIKLTRSLRLTGGVGYRFIDGEGRSDDRLSGATGSIALQIGGGF